LGGGWEWSGDLQPGGQKRPYHSVANLTQTTIKYWEEEIDIKRQQLHLLDVKIDDFLPVGGKWTHSYRIRAAKLDRTSYLCKLNKQKSTIESFGLGWNGQGMAW
jgi:hypothetical protein